MMDRGPAVSIVVAQKRQVIERSASLKVGDDGFGDTLDKAIEPGHFAQRARRLEDDGGLSDERESEMEERAERAMNAAVNVPALDSNPDHQHPLLITGRMTAATVGKEIHEAGSGTTPDGHDNANELQIIRRVASGGQFPKTVKHVTPSRSTLLTVQMPVPVSVIDAGRVLHTMGEIGDRISLTPGVGRTPWISSPPCRTRIYPPNLAEHQDALGPQHPAHWQEYGTTLSRREPMLDPKPTEPATSPAQQISERLGRALAEASADRGPAIPPSAMRSITIILQPDQLGTVQVSLTLQPEGLRVRIIAGEAGTADMLRHDRHQLDGLLQSLAGDAQASRVTISIEAARDGGDAAFLAEFEPTPQFQSGPSDSGFRRSHPGADETPATGKEASGNDPSGGTVPDESVAPIRRRLPGVIVV